MFEDIYQQIHDATIGYASMSIINDDDLGRGPKMVTRAINPRKINHWFLQKNFTTEVNKQGQQNKSFKNAIIVGVQRDWLVESSLQDIHTGVYNNHVKWTPHNSNKPAHKMVLYNGNHCHIFMQQYHKGRDNYHKLERAQEQLAEAKSVPLCNSAAQAVEDAT